MSRTQLADSRIPMTLADAEGILEQLAHLECSIAKRDAAAEAKINATKSAVAEANALDKATQELLEERLLRFVDGNPALFAKPRARKTEFGEFGRRKSTRLEIEDDAAAMADIEAQQIPAIETKRTINKPALKQAIEEGKSVAGCELREGEISYYTIAKALIKKALALDLTA